MRLTGVQEGRGLIACGQYFAVLLYFSVIVCVKRLESYISYVYFGTPCIIGVMRQRECDLLTETHILQLRVVCVLGGYFFLFSFFVNKVIKMLFI